MDTGFMIAKLGEIYADLEKKQKIVVWVSFVFLIGFLTFLIVFPSASSNKNTKVLYSSLKADEAAAIVEQLKVDGIKYNIRDDNTIEVPADVVYETRIKTANLIKSSQVGFELFDKQEFGATDFEQNVKYWRALEGELARTIESLNVVKSAKVHLSIPEKSLFVEDKIPPKASITVDIAGVGQLSRKQIEGIKNIVAASVPNLNIKDVSIVNSFGESLGSAEGFNARTELAKLQTNYTRREEAYLEQKIIAVLSPILGGSDRLVAKVTMEFDFSQQDTTREEFSPEGSIRSQVLYEKEKEGRDKAQVGGVPGVVSNIGPVQGLKDEGAGKDEEKESQSTTNYEISKVISNIKNGFAKVVRITAAVTVDGRYEVNETTGEVVYVPRSIQELNEMEKLVNNVIGKKEQRGDNVTVNNLEFAGNDSKYRKTGKLEQISKELAFFYSLFGPGLKYALVFLLLFVIYRMMIMKFAKQMVKVETEDDSEEEFTSILEEEEDEHNDLAEKAKIMRKKVEDQFGDYDELDQNKIKYDVLLEKMRRNFAENPEEIANIFESLVYEENMDERFGR